MRKVYCELCGTEYVDQKFGIRLIDVMVKDLVGEICWGCFSLAIEEFKTVIDQQKLKELKKRLAPRMKKIKEDLENECEKCAKMEKTAPCQICGSLVKEKDGWYRIVPGKGLYCTKECYEKGNT